jgi:DNA mismatch repair protein MutS
VVKRANEILSELEDNHRQGGISKPVGDLARHREGFQLSFFQLDDPVLQQIRDQIVNLDINNLTPVDALNRLNEIKRIAGLK